MIASAQTLRRLKPMWPFCERTTHEGMTYGLGPAGYDVRIAEDVVLKSGDFVLASTIERFDMPRNLLGIVHDKSTWARRGLSLFNTVIEPSWRGVLTLELANQKPFLPHDTITIKAGSPIAQVVFHLLDEPTDQPYPEDGKYMDQEAGPQIARFAPTPHSKTERT